MPAGDVSVTMGKCKKPQLEKYFNKDSIKRRVGGEYHPQELEVLTMECFLHCITVPSQKRSLGNLRLALSLCIFICLSNSS